MLINNIGYSQVFLEWHPTVVTSASQINGDVLKKPFCEDSYIEYVLFPEPSIISNPFYDPQDNTETTFENSFLFVVTVLYSHNLDFSIADVVANNPHLGSDANISFLGFKDLDDPSSNNLYGFFFEVNEMLTLPNNVDQVGFGNYNGLIVRFIQDALQGPAPSTSNELGFFAHSMDDFDLEEFVIGDLQDLELLEGRSVWFVGRNYILVDGSTSPQNLSDHLFSSPNDFTGNKLAHPLVACLKESGNGIQNILMVKGDLIIDVDYCYLNNVSNKHEIPDIWPSYAGTDYKFLYMTADSRIIIESGVVFTIDKTIITSCDTLWNSIVVEEGATLNIHDSYIRDGIHAIHVEPGGTVNLSTNIFDGNLVSFYTPPNPGTGRYAIKMGPFYGNEFIHENGLHAFPDGYSGLESEVPYAAIFVNDLVSFTAGGVGPAEQVMPNTISDIPLGLHAINSGVFLQNYSISNAYINNDLGYGGIGILLEQTTGVPSQIRNGVIANAEAAGITMDNGFNVVRDNSITGCPTGIRLTQTNLGINNLSDNHISALDFGILHNTVAGGYLNILDNEIFMEGSAPPPPGINNYGIALFGFGYAGSGGRFIENNDILIRSNSQKGIYANSVSHLRIRENTVEDLSDNVDYLGISITNSPFSLIDYNTVNRPDLATVHSTGILLRSSHSARVNCNQTEHTRYGLQVIGGNDNSELKGNEIGIHQDFGLLYGYGGQGNQMTPHITGIQSHHGNIWDDYYELLAPPGVLGARHMNDQDPTIFLASLFLVDSDDDPDYITTRFPEDWFEDETFGHSWSCPQERPESPWYDFNPRTAPTDWDDLLVHNFATFDNNPFYGSWRNVSERNLYERVMKGEYHSSALIGTALDTFMQEVDNSNVVTLYNVRETMAVAIDLDEADWVVVELKTDSIFTAASALFALDSIAWADTNNVDTAQWLTDRQAVIATIEEVSENLDQFLSAQAVDLSVVASQVQSTLSSITAEEAPEAFEAEMLHLIAGTVFRGGWDFSQAQMDLIEEISDLCPAFGGPAVFWARNIRHSYEPDALYNDTLCTDTWKKRVVREVLKETKELISVFPNPASSEINVDLPDADFEYWTVFSMDGKLIMEGRVDSSNMLNINTSEMESGQYLLKLSGKDSNHVTSFIIQNIK